LKVLSKAVNHGKERSDRSGVAFKAPAFFPVRDALTERKFQWVLAALFKNPKGEKVIWQ
jgi:hypothetical protein